MPFLDGESGPWARKARLPLEFVVVGASITGLACALNLKMGGHSVRVLEQDDGVGKAVGGIKCPPNMSRILCQWGLQKKLEKYGTRCPEISFRAAVTGETIGAMHFNDVIVRELGAGLFFLSHSDLHRMLYDLATEKGIKVDFGSKVVSIDESGPSVSLADGREICADIIIGADGAQSTLRPAVVGRSEKPETGPFPLYSFLVPASSIKNDEELEDLMLEPYVSMLSESGSPCTHSESMQIRKQWSFWMGDSCAILTHPANGGKAIAVYFVWPEAKDKAQPGWRTRIPYDTITEWPGFEPRIQRLMDLAPREGPIETRHIIHEELEDWYNDDENLVLMGEAADVINPGGIHATAMCIEDAAVFGSLFSRIQERSQISKLLAAYQDLRSERRRAIRESEFLKTNFLCMPKGPLQILRDDSLRKADLRKVEDWEATDDVLQHNWGMEYEGPFSYDAYEAVDEWWVEWGIISQRAAQREPIDAIQLQFAVMTTERNSLEKGEC